MDKELKDSLAHLTTAAFERGYRCATVDKWGMRGAIAAFFWSVGVLTGVVLTGWL